jgi:hypothetical protein
VELVRGPAGRSCPGDRVYVRFIDGLGDVRVAALERAAALVTTTPPSGGCRESIVTRGQCCFRVGRSTGSRRRGCRK